MHNFPLCLYTPKKPCGIIASGMIGFRTWHRYLLHKKLKEIEHFRNQLLDGYASNPVRYRMTENDFIIRHGTDGYLGKLYQEADRLAMML